MMHLCICIFVIITHNISGNILYLTALDLTVLIPFNTITATLLNLRLMLRLLPQGSVRCGAPTISAVRIARLAADPLLALALSLL